MMSAETLRLESLLRSVAGVATDAIWASSFVDCAVTVTDHLEARFSDTGSGQVLIFLSNLRTVPRARLSC